MNQLDSGDGLVKILSVLFASRMFIILILMILPLQRESLNKNQNSEIAKLWITELIQLENGAIWLVSIKELTTPFVATCNCFWLRRSNSRSLRVLLPLSLTCQSLMPMITKTLYSASARRKQMKTLKNFTSWKLALQLLDNKNSKNPQISRCNKTEISQFWCKIAQSSVLSSSSPNSVSCTCMKSQQPVSSTDKRSPTNSASFPQETQPPTVWLSSTEVVKSFLSMLKKTIWFHILTQLVILLITKLFHSSLLKDSIYLELMKCSSNFSTRKLPPLTMQELLTSQEMLQEHFWETKTLLTFLRIFHKQEVQLQFWFISTLSFRPQNWTQSNPLNWLDLWLLKTS